MSPNFQPLKGLEELVVDLKSSHLCLARHPRHFGQCLHTGSAVFRRLPTCVDAMEVAPGGQSGCTSTSPYCNFAFCPNLRFFPPTSLTARLAFCQLPRYALYAIHDFIASPLRVLLHCLIAPKAYFASTSTCTISISPTLTHPPFSTFRPPQTRTKETLSEARPSSTTHNTRPVGAEQYDVQSSFQLCLGCSWSECESGCEGRQRRWKGSCWR